MSKAPQYQIYLQNKSNEVKRFIIFNEIPNVATEKIESPFTNIWGQTDGIGAQNGDVTFEINEEYFAVCGTQPSELDNGLVIKPSDHEDVLLRSGSTKGTLVHVEVEEGGVVIDKTKKGTTEKKGSFAIKTGDYNLTKFSKLRTACS
jgi:hypothetical protein